MTAAIPATELRLISRGEAANLIHDPDFLLQWQRLHALCPWAGAFQSPDFVRAWFRCYSPDFAPLLVVSRTSAGLDGLLPLAISSDGKSLCHTGGNQAHCQSWICQMEDAMQFPRRALRLLQKSVRLPLTLTNLPAGLPLDWLYHKDVRQTVSINHTQRPLLRFCAHSDLQNALHDLQPNAEALKKIGPISLVRLETRRQLDDVISDILLFQNLKHAALAVNPPARQQARRRALHLLLADSPGLLYATVLKVGNRIASAQIALAHNRRLHLTALVANPILASMSPHKLHLRMLAQQLYAQDYCHIDMPDDADPQWPELCNAHVATRTVTFHASRSRCLLHNVDNAAAAASERILTAVGLPPATIEHMADKLSRSSPRGLLKSKLAGLRTFVRSRTELRMYRAHLDDLPPAADDDEIFRDRLDHLMLYTPCETWQSRHRFIRNAISRISPDTHIYTCADKNLLLHFSWLIENPGSMLKTEVNQHFDFPPGSVYLFDAYTLPQARGKGLCSRAQQSMIHDIRRDGRFRYIYVSVLANNHASRHIIEKMGFQYQTSLIQTITLGRARRWVQST